MARAAVSTMRSCVASLRLGAVRPTAASFIYDDHHTMGRRGAQEDRVPRASAAGGARTPRPDARRPSRGGRGRGGSEGDARLACFPYDAECGAMSFTMIAFCA